MIGSATKIGHLIRGAVSQSANLQEWQDSNAVQLIRITPSGQIGIRVAPSAGLHIKADGALAVGIRVEGFSAQSANLQEWHDSDALNVALITSAGGAVFNEGAKDTDVRIEGVADANLLFTDASTDRVGIGTNLPTEKLEVNGAIVYANVNSPVPGTPINAGVVFASGGALYFLGSAGSLTKIANA